MMDPSKRLTATEALQHVWIVETTAPATVPPAKDLVVPRLNHRLRRFVGMNKLKKVALNVIAQQLTEAEIGHLRKV
jgi:calcium-dependent protein kinase